MSYIQLTKREWHDIHNALCYLESKVERVVGVVREGDELRKRMDAMRSSLHPAYEQDNAKIEAEMRMWRETQSALGLDAVWSMSLPTENFQHEHGHGAVKVLRYNGFTADVRGSWWQDLYVAADAVIKAYSANAGGTDHIFVEGFRKNTDGSLTLLTGS